MSHLHNSIKVYAKDCLDDLLNQITIWNRMDIESVEISMDDLNLFKESYVEEVANLCEELNQLQKENRRLKKKLTNYKGG